MVNYLAVLVAGLAAMILGAFWYSPVIFGKAWMKLSGMKMPSKKPDKKMMTKSYILGLLSQLVKAYVLAYMMELLGLVTINGGLMTAFLAWLGFIATISLGSVLWEGKSWGLWFLNNTYNLVALLLMGLILGAWI